MHMPRLAPPRGRKPHFWADGGRPSAQAVPEMGPSVWKTEPRAPPRWCLLACEVAPFAVDACALLRDARQPCHHRGVRQCAAVAALGRLRLRDGRVSRL